MGEEYMASRNPLALFSVGRATMPVFSLKAWIDGGAQ